MLGSSSWLGHIPFTDEITGSSPVPSTYRGVEQLVARWAHNPKVTGSSPVPATMSKRYSESLIQDLNNG